MAGHHVASRDAAAFVGRADITNAAASADTTRPPGKPTEGRASGTMVWLADLAASEDGHGTEGQDHDGRHAVLVNRHLRAGAAAVAIAGRADDVAVHTAAQAGGELLGLGRRTVIDRDPSPGCRG